MKPLLFAICLLFSLYINAQVNKPRLEAYVAPGLFIEHISDDNIIASSRKNSWPLGDVTTYVVQFVQPLKNKKFVIKAGAGFSERHFSIDKYRFFVFSNTDSFSISKVRFTNNYFQVPLSFAYTVTNPYHNFQLAFGISFCENFLSNNRADVDFDSTYKIPTPADFINAKKSYTENISNSVFTVAPYVESTIYINGKLGVIVQISLPSYYGTRIDKKLTLSTAELIGLKFGAFYSFAK